jgi:hypothetical protein
MYFKNTSPNLAIRCQTVAIRCQAVAIGCQAVDSGASQASTVWRQVASAPVKAIE